MQATKILEAVTNAYIAAVYFTETGEDSGIPADAEMRVEARFRCAETCADFLAQCATSGLLDRYTATGRTWGSFGHDLWLTRNRHGAGFWDRGMGELGDELTDLARQMGEMNVYLGDDGLLYTC